MFLDSDASCRLDEKCSKNKDILREQKDVLDEENKTRGNKTTFEYLQDLVLLWNDSAVPNKLTLTQTKPTPHTNPSYTGGKLAWTWNSAFTKLQISSEGQQKDWGVSARQGRMVDLSQGLQDRRRLTQSSSVMLLLHPYLLRIFSEKRLVEQLNLCLARLLPAESSLKRKFAAAEISPYSLILIHLEKLTSKKKRISGKWRISGLSLGRISCKSLEGSWPRLHR